MHGAGRAGCPWDWVGTLMRCPMWMACFVLAAGCGSQSMAVLGTAPNKAPVSIETVRALKTAATVAVHGTMVEKCPVAGCWFNLRDSTGMVRVDTKAAGFVVLELPVGTKMTVQGKLSGDGDSRQIDATGLVY